MGTRSQQASKSGGRNLSWCGKHRQQGRLAAIKLEKEIKVLVEVASARAVPPPFLARGVLGTMRLGLKRIMQQGGSASFGPVLGGGIGGRPRARLASGRFTGATSQTNTTAARLSKPSRGGDVIDVAASPAPR